MTALWKRFFGQPKSQDTGKIRVYERIQQEACEERRRLDAFMRELSVYRGDRISLRKPTKGGG